MFASAIPRNSNIQVRPILSSLAPPLAVDDVIADIVEGLEIVPLPPADADGVFTVAVVVGEFPPATGVDVVLVAVHGAFGVPPTQPPGTAPQIAPGRQYQSVVTPTHSLLALKLPHAAAGAWVCSI